MVLRERGIFAIMAAIIVILSIALITVSFLFAFGDDEGYSDVEGNDNFSNVNGSDESTVTENGKGEDDENSSLDVNGSNTDNGETAETDTGDTVIEGGDEDSGEQENGDETGSDSTDGDTTLDGADNNTEDNTEGNNTEDNDTEDDNAEDENNDTNDENEEKIDTDTYIEYVGISENCELTVILSDGTIYLTANPALNSELGIASAMLQENGTITVVLTDDTVISVNSESCSVDSAHKHIYSEWEIVIEPTCNKSGRCERSCESCGIRDYRVLPSFHNLVEVDGKDATCKTAGYKDYVYCSECEYTTYSEVAVLPHAPCIVIIKEATCAEGGEGRVECSECGLVFNSFDCSPLGHTEEDGVCTSCNARLFTITVKYVFENGEFAANDRVIEAYEGEYFSIASPEIIGFSADQSSICGVCKENKEFTVTYTEARLVKIVSIEEIPLRNVGYGTPCHEIYLPIVVFGVTEEENRVPLAVIWELSGVNTKLFGEQVVSGEVIAGSEYQLECGKTVECRLNVVTNTIVKINNYDAGVYPLGTEIESMPSVCEVVLSDGQIHYLPVVWASISYDPLDAAKYEILGEIMVSEGYVFADGILNEVFYIFEFA